jgi:hypothetical protein
MKNPTPQELTDSQLAGKLILVESQLLGADTIEESACLLLVKVILQQEQKRRGTILEIDATQR